MQKINIDINSDRKKQRKNEQVWGSNSNYRYSNNIDHNYKRD